MEKILGFRLLDVGKFQISILQILEVMLVIVGAKVFSGLIARGLKRTSSIDSGAKNSNAQLISYMIMVTLSQDDLTKNPASA
jgi:hypothetical protein